LVRQVRQGEAHDSSTHPRRLLSHFSRGHAPGPCADEKMTQGQIGRSTQTPSTQRREVHWSSTLHGSPRSTRATQTPSTQRLPAHTPTEAPHSAPSDTTGTHSAPSHASPSAQEGAPKASEQASPSPASGAHVPSTQRRPSRQLKVPVQTPPSPDNR